jgi:hypothetical protein
MFGYHNTDHTKVHFRFQIRATKRLEPSNEHRMNEEGIYNFDETNFQMGVTSAYIVVTASEQRNRPKAA